MPLALAAVAWLVFFGLIRPGVKTVFVAPLPLPVLPGGQVNAIENSAEALPALEAPVKLPAEEQLEQARALAKENPAAVAGIPPRMGRPRSAAGPAGPMRSTRHG